MSSFQGHPVHTVAADTEAEGGCYPPSLQTSRAPEPEARALPTRPSTPPPPPSTRPGWRSRNAADLLNAPEADAETRAGNSTFSGNKAGILQTEFFKTLNRIIEAVGALTGFSAAAIFSLERGMLLEHSAEANLDLSGAVVAGAEYFRGQRSMLQRLGQRDNVQEIVVSLEKHYLILRSSTRYPHLLLVVILDRDRANLAVARFTLDEAAAWLEA